MFRVWSNYGRSFYIAEHEKCVSRCLHSDGSVYSTREFWPTRELAQSVLDKYQPAHVWKHGDVFETETLSQGRQTMIFLSVQGLETCVIFLASNSRNRNASRQLGAYLKNATFLFNIKSKL